jgi:hypothetical protein
MRDIIRYFDEIEKEKEINKFRWLFIIYLLSVWLTLYIEIVIVCS